MFVNSNYLFGKYVKKHQDDGNLTIFFRDRCVAIFTDKSNDYRCFYGKNNVFNIDISIHNLKEYKGYDQENSKNFVEISETISNNHIKILIDFLEE